MSKSDIRKKQLLQLLHMRIIGINPTDLGYGWYNEGEEFKTYYLDLDSHGGKWDLQLDYVGLKVVTWMDDAPEIDAFYNEDFEFLLVVFDLEEFI